MAYISNIRDLEKKIYYFNAAKVNNHSVEADVPSNAQFTDTTYQLFTEETDPDKGGLVPKPVIPNGYSASECYLTADGVWRTIEDGLSVLVESDLKYVKDDTSQGNNHVGTVVGAVRYNRAIGENSVAAGLYTVATQDNSLVIGKYNQYKEAGGTGEVFSIGNGDSIFSRKTVFSVLDNGNIYMDITQSSSDPLYLAIERVGGFNPGQNPPIFENIYAGD